MTTLPRHLKDLRDLCTLPEKAVARRFGARRHARGGNRPYWFRDNGSSILAVVHLDIVGRDHRTTFCDSPAGTLVASRALDDRLGAWGLQELQRRGLTFDVLLTTDEEIGACTSSHFEQPRDYDWMFSIDRGMNYGFDHVSYQYEDEDLRMRLKAAGGRMGTGSFSSISSLEFLGVKGLNFNAGYVNEHTTRCHAYLEDTEDSLDIIERFYDQNVGTRLPHVSAPFSSSSRDWGKTFSWELSTASTDREVDAAELESQKDWDDRYKELFDMSDAEFAAYADSMGWNA